MLAAATFEPGDFQKLVPADKKLSEAWITSLTARGEPTVYRGTELKYIGMPVGGICAGQLYLGGEGNFWLWDIFNELRATGSAQYKTPMVPTQVVDQGFAVRIVSGAKPEIRPLNAKGFPEVSFRGEYPIGTLAYTAQEFPLEVTMKAFSPFTPLNVDDSSLPATVMKFTVKNTSPATIEAELGGWLENVVAYKSSQLFAVSRVNRGRKTSEATMLECSYRSNASAKPQEDRPLIVFEDFEREDWGKWKADGTAFGSNPVEGTKRSEQLIAGYKGKRVANSYSGQGDRPVGKLTAEPFKIERRFINFLIGGGNHMRQDGQVEMGINLLVDGKVVRNATGKDTDAMLLASWDVSEFEGKTAVLEIVDDRSGSWGHINIDQIEFADRLPLATGTIVEQRDVGSLALALLDATAMDRVNPRLEGAAAEACFTQASNDQEFVSPANLTKATKPVGSVVRSFKLEPGASREITFVMSWHFPNLIFPLTFSAGQAASGNIQTEKGRYYGTQFDSAASVVGFIARNVPRLIGNTELWRDTWYDSTLPYWLLDRTLLNISTLASSNVQRFANGRFYGWEGVGNCGGTCTHVWHYEQAMGRLFPELDILLRDRVDYNPKIGFQASTGMIGTRGEVNGLWPSVDGQAGTLLRTYRGYLVSLDDSLIKRNWPQIKLATAWLMKFDSDKDGILDQPQGNTLDGVWYGKIPWLTSLGLAAVEASKQMALVMGDTAFAETCKVFVEAGRSNFVNTFWNGEYFEQIHDPAQLEHVGSYNGCLIDQVLGQGWAFQVGLDRVLPEDKTKEALNAIWKYNFASDVGPFREQRPAGRWYAMPGEAGTLMCSWPRGDKLRVTKGYDFYFNESMNGFEHQVAGHMIWEGAPGSELVKQGLAIQRAVHDRYHASKRNPWNEIEAGHHYARSMASYGVFIAATGFTYNGPEGRIGFAPKLTPENFKAAFTAAEGWGSYSQKQSGTAMSASLALKYGRLKLKELTLAPQPGTTPKKVNATLGGKPVAASLTTTSNRTTISFAQTLVVPKGQTLTVILE
ncbi:MAG: GH116 family glycosyl-hydrolase [Verrucomicrobia bacterium]|nr:GH116 family glycosyl-hydrolase [Verrucomicrobiota bacterium]